ncbi:quinone-dependent dihydroorotate dehydrogenase [Dokdonia sp. Hel_I_53]|uniref:quinone-dependent dihydroorotate dehydrogenase n=1 Tax=Dokdonia sp. Hel_I_53 TaxID=1566287 RepID=UPI001199D5EB|nr:quinone-dependent dihydroorotate dehydrogenase [Dokdonia sp. Hel_I_53]TVZ51142.1 dihydroorotate oxidase A [Dokdonia sp. Hel_I_53]
MYKQLIRPLLFSFDPEKVHYFTFSWIKRLHRLGLSGLLNKLGNIEDSRLEREVFGLKFRNPVGLAAGFDKDAKLYDELGDLGFGFVEIGTLTPKAQEGNPKKRLFRLKEDQGLINRMGFNNEGVYTATHRLTKVSQRVSKKNRLIIGGNIGKNTATSPEDYTADYLECFMALHPYVDYFVLNVSCPNVSSHAKLNDKDYLIELINAVQEANKGFEEQRPILLKIAPDLNTIQLDEIIDLVKGTELDGVIASNTSMNREDLKVSNNRLEEIGNGGLSGKPITDRSTQVIKYLFDKSNGSFPIIGVGGIHSAQDALDKLDAGASLVQLYTGFVYEGPSLIKKINKSILNKNL